MLSFKMMHRYQFKLLLAFASMFPLFLQAQIFIGEPVQKTHPAIEQRLGAWEVYRLDAETINAYVQANVSASELTLRLGAHQWHMALQPNYRLLENYKLQVLTPEGLQVSHPTAVKAFRGYEMNSSNQVSLTLDREFIYGCISGQSEKWYIEPLWYYDPAAPRDEFIVYKKSDVIYDTNVTCATVEAENFLEEVLENEAVKENEAEFLLCYTLEIAIASDKLMFTKYGSVTAVENHNIGVINNVQGDYTGNFNHDLDFLIVTQFVVTGTDPWTNSTDAGLLLDSFKAWGNAGNFGVNFDVGELWTNRDFDGSTIGIAWLNGICNSNKYHCLQDFSGNAELLRCMTSHELGHNFSAIHDGTSGSCPPNYIMCPFVSTSTTWSTQSSNSINSYMQTKINSGCLSPCGPPPTPPVADFDFSPDPGCPNVPITFSNLSTGTINSYSWTFQGGTPPSSTLANPTVTWSGGGTYNVTLTVSGPGGNSSLTKQVVITGMPVANFSSVVDDQTVTFTDMSANATTWSWDFGDGGFSNDQNPVYSYGQPGTYVVTLTVTNNCGTSMKTFVVNTAPIPAFSADPTSGCATLVVQFNNESSSNTSTVLWNFPGGIPATSTLMNPVVTYTTSGTYNVTLTAYNNSGNNTVTQTNYIAVQTIPACNFTWTINGLVVTFNNISNGATSFEWDFGDGTTSTETNPVHTYAVGGTYNVTLTSTNDCGSTVNTKILGLLPPPVAAFSAGPTSGCAPLTVQFTNATTGNATGYNWQFPGGNPANSTNENPTVVYNSPGAYNVTLIVSNAGGNDTLTFVNYINVSDTPVTSFTSVANGTLVNFTNTTTGGNSYSWSFGDGGTSTETSPSHTYATDGTYTVTLTATNGCGSTVSTQTIVITLAPTAAFSASTTSGCAPMTVQFSNQSTSNATTFLWDFPGGSPSSSTDPNPVVVYTQPGSYTVSLTASNTAGSGTATQTNYINVGTVPAAGFSSTINGAVADFTNSSTGATSYSWDFGDNGTSAAANPSHTYTTDGTYTVVLTATNACGSTTSTQTVVITLPPTASFSAGTTSGCAPLTVQFNNSSTSNATSFLWDFPGGSPSSSTETNPVVIYAQPGVYTVVLTAYNSAGSGTSTQTNYITVGTLPTAGFSSAVNGANASFTNSSSGATDYNWDFGDNSSATESNPNHTYGADGTYTVVLTASNNCGVSTSTQTVTIVTPPVAQFSVGTPSGCAPFTVNFNNTSSNNATSFEWTFEGGSPASSTDVNPTVVYTVAGTYSVTLVAANSAGTNTFTQTNYITVGTEPTAGFSVALNGATAMFTNNTSGGGTYSWDFGDNSTATEANPSHTYAADGVYTVVLTATNNCGSSTSTQTVTVVTPPVSAFTPGTVTGCVPLTVQFNNTSSSNATSFEWTFEGGTPANSTETNPSAVWNQPGTYVVTLTAANNAGTSTSTSTITVNTTPGSGFTYQLAGLSVLLANTSTNADSYLWAFGDGSISAETNPSHTYSGPGAYTITLTSTNGCGSTVYSTTIEIAGSAPIAVFSVENTNGCLPFSVNFTDLSQGDPVSWKWSFPGGSPSQSTEQNPVVVYSSTGTYDVTLEVTNAWGTGTTTEISYINVETVPTVGYTYSALSGEVSFNNQSQNADTYSWSFGDGGVSNLENPTHTYGATGTYTVELTAINNCGASTLQQTIAVIVTGTEEPNWVDNFRIYPNPNNGTFTVEMQGIPKENLEFNLYNVIGQLVKQEMESFNNGNLKKAFIYNDLQSGVYTLSISNGDSRMVVKLVVQ